MGGGLEVGSLLRFIIRILWSIQTPAYFGSIKIIQQKFPVEFSIPLEDEFTLTLGILTIFDGGRSTNRRGKIHLLMDGRPNSIETSNT